MTWMTPAQQRAYDELILAHLEDDAEYRLRTNIDARVSEVPVPPYPLASLPDWAVQHERDREEWMETIVPFYLRGRGWLVDDAPPFPAPLPRVAPPFTKAHSPRRLQEVREAAFNAARYPGMHWRANGP